MTAISVRLSDKLVHDMDDNAKKLHISRTSFIREAIARYNLELTQKARRDRLMKLSKKVRASSLRINQEFSEIEHDPEN